MEKPQLTSQIPTGNSRSWIRWIPIVILCSLGYLLSQGSNQAEISFDHLSNHCRNAQPISASEFHERQQALANTLYSLNASAYVAEPGPNSLYFANISTRNWWLSERPFLLVITPEFVDSKITPKVSIITPAFEATRAAGLRIPTSGNLSFVKWAEEESPFTAAISAMNISGDKSTIYVDEEARYFIADGIREQAASLSVRVSPPEIRSLRERKSLAELQLLQCANEVTLEALREVHKHLFIGIKESEAHNMIVSAMKSAGLTNPEALVLFGENAALPHGSGTDRQLDYEDFALFDLTGSLFGYYSDLTRTVAIPDSRIPPGNLATWYTVKAAQSAAISAAKEGATADSVDSAARQLIRATGAGKYFTHRLGHGIGIQVHEGPYLRGRNQQKLAIGNTFSDEPGVYIEGEVGVRLEDCFVIDENGEGNFLTARVGGQALSPWRP